MNCKEPVAIEPRYGSTVQWLQHAVDLMLKGLKMTVSKRAQLVARCNEQSAPPA